MKSKWTTIAVIASTLALDASASLIEELGSPDQKVRDSAAAELRRTFQDTPEAKWTPIVEKIKKSQSKKAILELLAPFKISIGMGAGSGQTHSECYRLDDEWLLQCDFYNDGDFLIDRRLIRSMREIFTAPPKDFTGKWTTYFVNGNTCHEINLKNGRYIGDFTAYHSNGKPAYVQHYGDDGIDGEEIGYHPSGKVAYRGQHKNGKQVGIWTWYDGDGKVTSTREYPSP